MGRHCDNEFCDFEAVKTVPVWDTAKEAARALCASCLEAYVWGVQYGRWAATQQEMTLGDPTGKVKRDTLPPQEAREHTAVTPGAL